jgi:TonB-linked SusC/RagA family outer membrane protein
MKKIRLQREEYKYSPLKKLMLMAKLTSLFIFISFLQISANSYSQTGKLDLKLRNATILEVFEHIEDVSPYRFFYDNEQIDLTKKVSINTKNEALSDILEELLDETELTWEVKDKLILVQSKKAKANSETVSQQQNSISGTVTDESGESLPGVTVIIKGTTNGTVTNMDGNFSISNIPDNATLAFSFIGMLSQEIAVGSQTSINVTMKVDAIGIEEVVAIGYGTQRKSNIVSAVSDVDLSTVEDVYAPNAAKLIQGQAAGVQVNQSSGLPGADMQVRIRGISSLGAGSDPLYVVDGFPVGNSLRVNPVDIESITILKDASSTAIYGARGSNGVILVNTKSAKDGEAKIEFSATLGVQNIPDSRRIDIMTAQEFGQFQKERITTNFIRANGREPDITDIPEAWRYPEDFENSTDWFEEITDNNAPTREYGIRVMNGSKKTKSLLSLGYFKQDGTIINTDFERFNARLNLRNDFNKYVHVEWSLDGTYEKNNTTGNYSSGFTSNIINAAYSIDPRDPVYNSDGSFNDFIGGKDGPFGYPNPVQRLHEEINQGTRGNIVSNGALVINPIEGLSFRTSVNASITNNSFRHFRPSTLANWNVPPPTLARGYENRGTVINYAWDNLLTYKLNLKDHNLDFMVGNTIQKESYEALAGNGSDYPDDFIPYLSAAAITTSTTGLYDWSLSAFFGRFHYSYLDRYLVSATMRREGSSRFGSNNKWADFPSLAAGWKISEESFFPENTFIDQLKLRGSFGITGNNNIGNYSHLSGLRIENYIFNNSLAAGKALSSAGNPDLTWEKSSQMDIGLDLNMFRGKLSFVAEYYKKITNDMLLPVEVPSVSGFTSSLSNIGEVENKGFEFAIVYKEKIGQIGVNSNFNIAFNKNEILEINDQADELFQSFNFYGANSIFRVGQPIGMLYGYVNEGIFETEEDLSKYPSHPGNTIGTYRYKDVNGDGKVTYDSQDWDIIGNPHPKFTWGWNVALTYKRFDLGFNFVGMQKYDLYRNYEGFLTTVDGIWNLDAKMNNRWKSPESPGNGYAGTGNWQFTREVNSKFVHDASHVWLRNITLGYDIPKINNFLSMRVFFNVDNVAVFTKYPGNNPQSNDGDPMSPQMVKIGVDNDSYPVPRTYTLGLKINL